jgi:O-antigen/teichoic acid export membrane protein
LNNVKVLSNFIWRFLERTGAQLVQLLVSIVLARILEATVYGTVALMNVFLNILNVLLNCNLATALIQKKDADDIDFSTIFYSQIVFSLILYSIVFISAPYIEDFYDTPKMTEMLRVLGLFLIISGVRNIQNAYVSKTMQFKRFFIATLVGTICSAFIGVGMAKSGFGAWALIAQTLSNNFIDTIILWLTVKWRPIKAFSFKRLKSLFSYSWKLVVSALLERVETNLNSIIIGKKYSSSDLAQYNRGQSWPVIIVDNINASIDSVLLPTMSLSQDTINTVKNMTRRAIKISIYLMAPLMIGLASIGTPLVRLILTEKWLPCVEYQTIFCIAYMFQPINTANLNAIKALGRSDLFLKLQVIKTIVDVIIILFTCTISIKAMAYGVLFNSFTRQIINSWPNKKLMNYRYTEQLKDILPSVFIAFLMGLCIYPIQFLALSDILTIILQVITATIIYILLSIIFKIDSFTYLLNLIKPKR